MCRLSVPLLRARAPDSLQYFGVLVRFVTIAYTTLILVPLQMLQCVDISGRLVWWFDASVSCYEQPFQKAAIFAVAMLCPLPFVCMIAMQRWSGSDLAPWQQEVARVLSNGYTDKRRWWLGVSLLRRLLLVITFVNVQDLAWRSVTTTVLCIGRSCRF